MCLKSPMPTIEHFYLVPLCIAIIAARAVIARVMEVLK